MEAREAEVLLPGRSSSGGDGPAVCALCLSAPGKYTCPRCNAPYCSLACYRGARHSACSELFYRDSVLQALREEGAGGAGRRQIEETLLRLREEETRCGSDAVIDEEGGLWDSLTRQEREHFNQLLDSGHIASLVPQWKPWWDQPPLRHKIVELAESEPCHGDAGHHATKQQACPISSDTQETKGALTDGGSNQHGCHQAHPVDNSNTDVDTRPKEDETSQGDRSLDDQSIVSAIPPLLESIPPLCSLTRRPSPLVRFSLVSVLYSYAFTLLRYNGDLSDPDILVDFIGTLLSVSGALSTTTVYNSTAHALKSAVRAASDPLSGGDEGGAVMAMEATAKILLGDGGNVYSMAALSHLYRLLGRVRKVVTVEKDVKKGAFNAKKKCLFLTSWANENGECLAVLSAEVMMEYKQHLKDLNEVAQISEGLKQVWGGKRPPAKKTLIQEVN